MAKGEYNSGQLLLKRGQVDPAIAAFKKALVIDPDFAEVYYGLGLAFMKKGEADEAIIGFRRSLELDPTNAEAATTWGSCWWARGNRTTASSSIKSAGARSKVSSAETNLGVALFQAGLKDEAMKHLRQALELDPASDEANNNLGNALLATGQLMTRSCITKRRWQSTRRSAMPGAISAWRFSIRASPAMRLRNFRKC